MIQNTRKVLIFPSVALHHNRRQDVRKPLDRNFIMRIMSDFANFNVAGFKSLSTVVKA